MKIALCLKDENINSELDNRFGRAGYFLIYNTETKEKTVVENIAKDDQGGAGGRAIRFIYQNNAEILIAPELGPKALEALKAFEIEAYFQGESNNIDEVLKKFEKNELKKIEIAGEEKKGLYRA